LAPVAQSLVNGAFVLSPLNAWDFPPHPAWEGGGVYTAFFPTLCSQSLIYHGHLLTGSRS